MGGGMGEGWRRDGGRDGEGVGRDGGGMGEGWERDGGGMGRGMGKGWGGRGMGGGMGEGWGEGWGRDGGGMGEGWGRDGGRDGGKMVMGEEGYQQSVNLHATLCTSLSKSIIIFCNSGSFSREFILAIAWKESGGRREMGSGEVEVEWDDEGEGGKRPQYLLQCNPALRTPLKSGHLRYSKHFIWFRMHLQMFVYN